MMKMTIIDRHPPPHFQAAAPARHPRNGPSMLHLEKVWSSPSLGLSNSSADRATIMPPQGAANDSFPQPAKAFESRSQAENPYAEPAVEMYLSGTSR